MDILQETVEIVKDRLSGSLEGITVERMVIGVFFTGVKISNGSGGICFTPVKEIPEAVCCPTSFSIVALKEWSLKRRRHSIRITGISYY